MRLTVLAASNEEVPINAVRSMEIFSGKMAGICYMKGEYFGTAVSDIDKAANRFDKIIGTGHHSISDHCFITVLFEDIPKMTAMILNSIGFYNTSEKSGRYTIMYSEGENKILYDKWFKKFYDLILEYDPNIDNTKSGKQSDLLRTKLAQENARYMLSIFEKSTTMGYTTSLRMWSYLVCWLKEYLDSVDEKKLYDKMSLFNQQVYKCINDLYLHLIHTDCFSRNIVDTKGRKLDFLAKQVENGMEDVIEIFSDAYTMKYRTSFANLAQEQRHRTIDYYMLFDGYTTDDKHGMFYVPMLIRDNPDLTEEWLTDLYSVKDTFPNATLVDVVEMGTIQNFMLKCDERLCGRTMLETMMNVKTNLMRLERSFNKSPHMMKCIERHMRDGEIIMKCGNIRCNEPCYWGPSKSKTKLI